MKEILQKKESDSDFKSSKMKNFTEKTKNAVCRLFGIERNYDPKELMNLINLLNSSLSMEEIKNLTIEDVTSFFGGEAWSLLFLDEEANELYFDVAKWKKWETVKEQIRVPIDQWIAGHVAQTKKPLVINDVQNDERFFKKADKTSWFVTRNMMCCPVQSGNKLFGVVQVLNKKSGDFTEEDLEILVWIANAIWISLDNAWAYETVKKNTFNTISSLAEIIWTRDEYTWGHTKRVMYYCYQIAKKMGLDQEEINELVRWAVLHDIWKVGIQDDVLRKNWALDDEEFEIMKQHASIWGDLVKNLDFLKNLVPIVRGHHERIDWKWYPDWLTWDQLTTQQKIICVADAFDAMITTRPYKQGFSIDKAVKILEENKWTQFDPEVVDAFLELIEDIDFEQINQEGQDYFIKVMKEIENSEI